LKKQSFTLQLLVEGSFARPMITLNKRTYELPQLLTEISEKEALAMRAKATLLFSSDGNLSQPCTKFITVTNPMEQPVVVNLHTEGALVIKDAGDNLAVQTARYKDEGSVTSGSTPSRGKTLSLAPHVSLSYAYHSPSSDAECCVALCLLLIAIYKTDYCLPTSQAGA
jgi:hypothetical protein